MTVKAAVEFALMVTGLDARQSGTPDAPLGRPD
jgi:hypothetical protein